jgi:hypothetical protein
MNPAPPKIDSANARFAGLVLAATVAGIATVVFFFNPATHRFYPVCQFHQLTGLSCPGCGMTRALHALLHGNFAAALRDNALLVGGLALLGVRGVWFAGKSFCGRANGEFFPAKFLWPLLAVVVVFTVLRNLPAGAFLAP